MALIVLGQLNHIQSVNGLNSYQVWKIVLNDDDPCQTFVIPPQKIVLFSACPWFRQTPYLCSLLSNFVQIYTTS